MQIAFPSSKMKRVTMLSGGSNVFGVRPFEIGFIRSAIRVLIIFKNSDIV